MIAAGYSIRRVMRLSDDGRILRWAAMCGSKELGAYATRGRAASMCARHSATAAGRAMRAVLVPIGPRRGGTLSLPVGALA